MTQWEYRFEVLEHHQGAMAGTVTKLGREGWELVNAVPELGRGGAPERWHLWLKRPTPGRAT